MTELDTLLAAEKSLQPAYDFLAKIICGTCKQPLRDGSGHGLCDSCHSEFIAKHFPNRTNLKLIKEKQV